MPPPPAAVTAAARAARADHEGRHTPSCAKEKGGGAGSGCAPPSDDDVIGANESLGVLCLLAGRHVEGATNALLGAQSGVVLNALARGEDSLWGSPTAASSVAADDAANDAADDAADDAAGGEGGTAHGEEAVRRRHAAQTRALLISLLGRHREIRPESAGAWPIRGASVACNGGGGGSEAVARAETPEEALGEALCVRSDCADSEVRRTSGEACHADARQRAGESDWVRLGTLRCNALLRVIARDGRLDPGLAAHYSRAQMTNSEEGDLSPPEKWPPLCQERFDEIRGRTVWGGRKESGQLPLPKTLSRPEARGLDLLPELD